jgi:hypothetical protein
MKLLNYTDIENLIKTPFCDDKALILTQNLKSFLIIVKSDIYEITDNIIYLKLHGDINDKIITFLSKYISDSVKHIYTTENDKIHDLKDNRPKDFNALFQNSFLKSILPQLKNHLTDNDIIFNVYSHQIHFKNGYMDLKENKFKERVLNKNFITKYINRDYHASSKEQRDFIKNNYLKKIYTVKEDREIILNIMGTAFAGLAQQEQKMTFLLGKGSSGKSTIINFSEASFGCYFKELDDNTFKEGNSKKDKIINTYLSDPQILLTVINEMQTTRIDKSLYKKFCDGKLQTTKLFLDDAFTVNHNSSLICLANDIPQGELFSDTGGQRRCIAYQHKSEFVDEHERVDNKTTFLKNKDLINEFKAMDLYNAWCDIIFERSYGLINKKIQIVYNNAFNEMKNMLVNAKNYIDDFIKTYLHFENGNDELRIHKDDMLEKYKEETNDIKMTGESLMAKLKLDYNLKYDSTRLRCKLCKKKGVWLGVRFKTSFEIKESLNEDGTEEKQQEAKSKSLFIDDEVSTLKKENEELKKRIASLELMLNQSVEEEDDDGEEVQIDDVEIEIEPKTASYNRDYNRDEQMEILFNQLI